METIAKVTISIQKREAIGKVKGKCHTFMRTSRHPSQAIPSKKILWARATEQKAETKSGSDVA